MDLVLFESIKFAMQSKRAFDFEGSMIESIEKYFRAFGAIQKPYYSISKINSKLLRVSIPLLNKKTLGASVTNLVKKILK